MSDVKLGILVDPKAKRDAIHIAIAPVMAKVDVQPGQAVDQNGAPSKSPVGIVDPYLTKPVKAGEWFYICLYPQTVTSLRHEWTHPGFDENAESVAWLKNYAEKFKPYDDKDHAYDLLIEGLKSGELFAHGTDLHYFGDLEDADELKFHAEKVLGIRIDWDEFTFSCSC